MSLRLTHPEVPTCDECCKWVYDPKTWTCDFTERDRREPGEATPCWQCPKIPKGEPQTPATGRLAELTPENEEAYTHYRECKAVGRFPEDSIVERHAGLIRMVEDHVAREAAKAPMEVLLAVLAMRR